MCIAILNTYSTLSRESLKNCWENNFDGAGLLWVNSAGNLETFKELNSFKVFFKKYSEIRANHRGPVVLHFRIGTHGNHAEYNLHPFLISPEIGFVHNGVFRLPEIEKKYSDTWHFNSLILQTMKSPARLFKLGSNESHLINHFVGGSSKLIFLNRKEDWRIFNEAAGHWDKFGNWYSNHSYKASKYIDFGGKKVAKSGPGKYQAPRHYYGPESWEKEYSREYLSPYAESWKSNVPAPAPAQNKYGAYSEMIDAAEKWAKNPKDSRTEIILPGNPAPAPGIPAPAPAKSEKPRIRLSTKSDEYGALETISATFGISMNDKGFSSFISALLNHYGVSSYSDAVEYMWGDELIGHAESIQAVKSKLLNSDEYKRGISAPF